MTLITTLAGRPRAVGLCCATGAVALGLVYLTLAGAPPRYLALNLGAWTLGVTLLCALGSLPSRGWQRHGALLVAMAAILLATGLIGSSVAGAARWLRLGGLALQPSLVLLPGMLVASARGADRLAAAGLTTAALGLTALALAIQPDRAMAGVLVAALGVLALRRPQPPVAAALAVGLGGFAVTLLRADALPAVPFVDQVLSGAFAVHPLAGLAVLIGAGLLVVPALVGWARDPANRTSYAVFGVVWAGVIAAAALGNYPTPLVGYGGSAILGYALSLLALPRRAGAAEEAGASRPGQTVETRGGRGANLLHKPA
ncbi:FtsW/RodA/SpoVE family cell cycle protein [Novosphingobium piscinae]|uniref:FtsW/RodA/SpoVE family cell cycle protein n=2 Tax=Novosphingobium piscinae TaxID=1507448 RepID=A0A7X1G149_9SPHN|nr:FtsW/RodA/SpoVE family cell cycle protein [Novosphingobium piscinae]MBC2670745.1 FtsW/RodA/SpoVE family cell cycle protein [Novosphingobium piscinae]